MKSPTVTTKILFATVGAMLPLAFCLMALMGYFLNGLTDSITTGMLQPMARTAAQNVENRLHTLAEPFFLLSETRVLRDPQASIEAKQAPLSIVEADREYNWLGLYEVDGTLLTGSDASPRTITGRPIFPLMCETSNLVIEKTSIGDRGPEIVMGTPVFLPCAEGGKTTAAYYLVGSYAYDVLSDVLRDINIGARGTAFIIDQEGYIIAHKDLGKVFSREAVRRSLGDGEEAEAIVTAMTRQQTGSAKIHALDESVFIAFSPIKGTMWSLGVQAPRDDFMAAAKQALILGVSIVAAALLGAALLVVMYTRSVLSVPLAAITGSARQLAVGNFGEGLPPELTKRHDEIGQLAVAFSRMSASVQALIKDMRELTVATGSGKLDVRAYPSAYYGDFRRIVNSMNVSMGSICVYLDSMPDALLLLSQEGARVYHNKPMARLLARHGWREDDPDIFSAITAAFSDEIEPEAMALFTPDARGLARYEREAVIADTTGEEYCYTLSLNRVNGPVGAFCVMLVLKDISAVARARTQAEAANHAKSDFLSRMSHEMRTPMNAIIGMAAIGLNAEEAQRKQYCLQKIDGASQHLLGVINDILDMSKIEADKFELSSSSFRIADMLLRVIDVIKFQTEEKSQQFSISIDERLSAWIVADEQRMAQVITNLLSNAAKFTPEYGKIALHAELSEKDTDCPCLRIAVSDTGIGMSEEQRSRLFRPFEQADGSISRKFGGTGLGLAISKRIAELMGGNIFVQSAPGEGSTFIFEVPAPDATPEQTEQALAHEKRDSAASTLDIFQGKRVLLAEDVDLNREIFASLLEHTKLGIVFAGDGQEALNTFSANPQGYDLILMDVQMPHMDGYEATTRIRASGLPGAASIPIVAMTANVFREDIERCLAAGMNSHLGKPIDPEEVIDTLGRYFGIWEKKDSKAKAV